MKRYLYMACAIVAALTLNTELALVKHRIAPDVRVRAEILGEPELPRVFLNTTLVPPTGITINVPAGGNLQSALNAAVPGDEVVLQAGATFTGNFTLPNKPGSGWITIRTSNMAGMPAAGTRVNPAQHAAAMARLRSPNADSALSTQSGAHNYRLIGLDIGLASTVMLNFGIVRLGTGSETSTLQLARDITVDRCYIHGNATGDVARGVALNSASTAVIDSYISNCHGVGFDTQAICGWNGPGPFKIVNNYLEASGENVMFGGADPKILGLVPSDIEFRRNHCFKPLSWNMLDPSYAGIHWTVKNIFELKNARRVLVEGNLMENNWADGQSGAAILFTPRNQEGTAPWSAVQDVVFRKNIIRNVGAGVAILGTDYIHPSQRTERIKVENNLFDGVGGPMLGANGRLYQITDGAANVIINHNTGFQSRHVVVADGAYTTGFVYTNNITAQGEFGIFGSGAGEGNLALTTYFPVAQVGRNVLTGRPSWSYPANNYFPSSLDQIGFVNRAGGNYRLASTSPYKNAGTDGRDIGADIDAIQAAMGAAPQAPNQLPQVLLLPSTYGGVCPLAVSLSAEAFDPDGQIVAYRWDCGDGRISTDPMVWHVYQTSGVFTVRLTVTDNLGATATAETLIAVASHTDAQVKVAKPNTRETLRVSATYNIEWTVGGCEVRHQEIELSLDNGLTWQSVVQDLPAAARSYTWRVPKTPSQQARIRVTSYGTNGAVAQDMSDTSFIISKSGR